MKFLHLSGNVREHLVLVLQFDAEHGVGQRLDHRGHYFDGVFFRVAVVGLFLFGLWSSRHELAFSFRYAAGRV